MLGFQSFQSANKTLKGIEAIKCSDFLQQNLIIKRSYFGHI